MVGTLILILPVYAIDAGYASSFLSILISGCCCAFSSWIYLQHLGEEPDTGHALKKHFHGNFYAKLAYDFAAWASLVLACIEYLQLIVIQWTIIIPPTITGPWHFWMCLINGLLMFCFVMLLKYW